MKRTRSLPAFLALLPAALLLAAAGGCSKEKPQAPPAVVKKVAPKEAAKPAAPAADNAAAKAPAPAEAAVGPTATRDPFEPYIRTEQKAGKGDLSALPPLQRYDLSELKFVGVIWGIKTTRGLLEDAEGKGYVVLVGTKVGRSGGVVTRITDKEIFFTESSGDPREARTVREVSLKLRKAGGQE